jgi:hypothetical protein
VDKNRRFEVAKKNVDLELNKVIFTDESSLNPRKNGLYINRKKKTRPKASGFAS